MNKSHLKFARIVGVFSVYSYCGGFVTMAAVHRRYAICFRVYFILF